MIKECNLNISYQEITELKATSSAGCSAKDKLIQRKLNENTL